MKTIKLITTAVAALMMACPSTTKAQELQYGQGFQPEQEENFDNQIEGFQPEQEENFDNQIEGSVGLDMVSHYMWRGTDKGNVTILPFGQISWKGAFLKLHGATGLDKEDAKEINISLGYKYKFSDYFGVNIGATDYWTSGKDYEGRNLYFEWDPVKNGHQLEANLGFDFGLFSIQGYTMVWGNDFKYQHLDDVENRTNGKRAWSTFIELNIPFYMGGIDWDMHKCKESYFCLYSYDYNSLISHSKMPFYTS